MRQLLITAPFPSHLVDKIRAVSPNLTIEQRTLPNGRWPEEWTTEAEIYYALSAVPPIAQAPNLKISSANKPETRNATMAVINQPPITINTPVMR